MPKINDLNAVLLISFLLSNLDFLLWNEVKLKSIAPFKNCSFKLSLSIYKMIIWWIDAQQFVFFFFFLQNYPNWIDDKDETHFGRVFFVFSFIEYMEHQHHANCNSVHLSSLNIAWLVESLFFCCAVLLLPLKWRCDLSNKVIFHATHNVPDRN